MSETDPSSLCGNCVSACCRGKAKLTLALDSEEAGNLQAVGTVLREFLPAGEDVDWGNRGYFKHNAEDARKFIKKQSRNLSPGQGLFGLVSDCGFLEETPDGKSVCGVHDNPELKPDVCDSFRATSKTCLDVRQKVVVEMRMEDVLEADLVDISLGKAALRTFAPAFE